jgi:peptidyl-tRNA hydrolase
MANGIIFGNIVDIWDSCKNERVKIGIGTCRDPSFVMIYVVSSVETCIMVLIVIVFKAFEEPLGQWLEWRYFGH